MLRVLNGISLEELLLRVLNGISLVHRKELLARLLEGLGQLYEFEGLYLCLSARLIHVYKSVSYDSQTIFLDGVAVGASGD